VQDIRIILDRVESRNRVGNQGRNRGAGRQHHRDVARRAPREYFAKATVFARVTGLDVHQIEGAATDESSMGYT
jgi:hypothetical protein